jgi:hypothetical protein
MIRRKEQMGNVKYALFGATGAVGKAVPENWVQDGVIPWKGFWATKQFDAIRSWNPSQLPSWLNEKAYRNKILSRLSKFTVKTIRLALEVSHPYASMIRKGERIPHLEKPGRSCDRQRECCQY